MKTNWEDYRSDATADVFNRVYESIDFNIWMIVSLGLRSPVNAQTLPILVAIRERVKDED